ncbi:MAG: AmmeMemoRadiSam system protein B [Candidatus Aenigmatarchaeota archaeon]
MIRKPAVAGYFYPDNENVLKKTISSFVEKNSIKQEVKGIVVPHAGYMYSGKVAASVYSQIIIPDDIILISPNHTGMGARGALMASGEWKIPGGSFKINSELAEMILANTSLLVDDHVAHLKEHSLEVQLPFIHYFRQSTETHIIPITLMYFDYRSCEEIGKAIARAVKDWGEKILIVASTDMSHYESQRVAEEKDRLAVERILAIDPQGLHRTVEKYDISMCGVISTTVALVACQELGAKEAELIKYSTSGDVTGDYRSVVGYAGLIIK